MGKGQSFKCDLCGQSVNVKHLYHHSYICHEKLMFGYRLNGHRSTVKCSECGENQTASEYTLHLHQHRFDCYGLVKPLLKCRVCDIFLMTEIQREQHEKIHTLTTETIKNLADPYRCRYCYRPFKDKKRTLTHESACPSNPNEVTPLPLKPKFTNENDGVALASTPKKEFPQRSNGNDSAEILLNKRQPSCTSNPSRRTPLLLKRKSTDDNDGVAQTTGDTALLCLSTGDTRTEKPSEYQSSCHSNQSKGNPSPIRGNCIDDKGVAPSTRKKSLPQRSNVKIRTEIPPIECKRKIKRIDRWGNNVTCFRDATHKTFYKCDLCGNIRGATNFHHHSYLCHQKVMFGNCSIQPTSMVTCTFCDSSVVASKYALHAQRHRWLLYQEVPQFRCAKCKLTFWSHGQLDFHKKIHDLNKNSIKKMDNPFQCDSCGKTFPEIAAKILHQKYCERGSKTRIRYNKAIKPKRKIFVPETLPTTEDIKRNQVIEDFGEEIMQEVSYRSSFYPCGNCDFLSTNKNVGPQKMIKHCTLFHGVTFKNVTQAQINATRDSAKNYLCYVCGHLFYSAAFARCHVEYCELVNGLTTADTGALKNIPMIKHV